MFEGMHIWKNSGEKKKKSTSSKENVGEESREYHPEVVGQALGSTCVTILCMNMKWEGMQEGMHRERHQTDLWEGIRQIAVPIAKMFDGCSVSWHSRQRVELKVTNSSTVKIIHNL